MFYHFLWLEGQGTTQQQPLVPLEKQSLEKPKSLKFTEVTQIA